MSLEEKVTHHVRIRGEHRENVVTPKEKKHRNDGVPLGQRTGAEH